jgi:hypothetical protein
MIINVLVAVAIDVLIGGLTYLGYRHYVRNLS